MIDEAFLFISISLFRSNNKAEPIKMIEKIPIATLMYSDIFNTPLSLSGGCYKRTHFPFTNIIIFN
jgi:hypothetical protein